MPAETLLGAILADHHPGRLCVVQFVSCGDRAAARAVALAFAAASASLFDRTLAIETDADLAEAPSDRPTTRHGPTEIAMAPTTPDASIPRLSHARIGTGCALPIRTLLRNWSDAPERPFAMVVLDSPVPAISAQAITLAQCCAATILVARAGVSPLAAMRDTQRRLGAAEAVLLGFVFVRDASRPASLLARPR